MLLTFGNLSTLTRETHLETQQFTIIVLSTAQLERIDSPERTLCMLNSRKDPFRSFLMVDGILYVLKKKTKKLSQTLTAYNSQMRGIILVCGGGNFHYKNDF